MEERRFEKQPGLVKIHKVATVLMWISWALFFVAMLGTYNFFLVGEKLILVMLYILGVAAVGLLLSFSLFSWVSFQLKTVNETGWQLALTGGFLITFLMFTLRIL